MKARSEAMSGYSFAIPGDSTTLTGGYIYDARVAAASDGALTPLALPAGFPFPTDVEIETARDALAAAPGPVLVDGLAYGALPAELIAALPRAPVALCHHPLGKEPGLSAAEARRLMASERAALGLARHVIVTSAETKRALADELDVAPERVTVAPPGLGRAAPAKGRAGAPLILAVGSLTVRKGHDVLIAALARLATTRPDLDWEARIAGADHFSPGTAATLRRQVAEAGLAARIRLLGAQTPEALDRLYDEAAIFALASRYEGYGMVFAEAMMRALPVVACDAGAVAELVPETAGRLAPVDDASTLAAALETLLEDAGLRARMGASGREHALKIPGWDATWATIERVLRADAP